MDIDFEDNPILKWSIIGLIIILLIGGGLFYMKGHKKAPEKTQPTNQYAYLFATLPNDMTIMTGGTSNPFIVDANQVRLPTDANLVYISGVHYVYTLDTSSKPVVFLSETINAKYTGPNITMPVGVQYTAVGSDTKSGAFSNFWNFYFINGVYVGTLAVNGAPSIVTTTELPSEIITTDLFNYGMATAIVTEISSTQILLIINVTTNNGIPTTIGWWFMPDRIVREESFVSNNTTYEYTYYMQIAASPNQYMTIALNGS